MTAIADAEKRVYLEAVKLGDRFDVQMTGEGTILLRPLEPAMEGPPAKVKFEKHGRFTVGVLDRPVNMEAVKELLAEFP